MKIALATIGVVLAACSSDHGSRARYRGFPMMGTSKTVWNIVFGADSTPYLQTDTAPLHFDGTAFVPVGPPLTPDVPGGNSAPFHIEHDGTMFQGSFRARPGDTAWENLGVPTATMDQTTTTPIATATDGSLYAFGPTADARFQLYRKTGDNPWSAVGYPVAQPSRPMPDAQGRVWFETSDEGMFYALGDTLEYVGRSTGLGMIGPDGTRYYFTGSANDTLLPTANYNPVLAVSPTNVERILTRGTCVDTQWACPTKLDGNPGMLLGGQLAGDGRLYQVWTGTAFDPSIVLALSPGDVSWHPVADISDSNLGLLIVLFVAPDGTMWTTQFDQVGGIDSFGNTLNETYSYVFRIDP